MPAQAWSGGPVPPWGVCVLAANPGPMTLDGTNTWVLDGQLVVDPGPADDAHLARVLAACRPGLPLLTVLTHRHADHAAGAARWRELSGSPVRALDPGLCAGAGPLSDGERLAPGHRVLATAVATPGHTSDSVCLLAPGGPAAAGRPPALLTGDTLLGRGSTVVEHPDGRLGDYLASLRRLRHLVEDEGVVALLPGHGAPRADPRTALDEALAHRERRLSQVRQALADGATGVDGVLRRVYAGVDERVLPAAARSVAAQLEHLAGEPPV